MQDNKYDKYIYGGLISVFVLGLFLSFKKKRIFRLAADNWSKATNFFTTTKGINLSAIASRGGIKLSRNKGIGSSGYSASKYQSAKKNPKVYWAIYNISKDTLIAKSSNANKNVYGASVPKVIVASAALDKFKGNFPNQSDYDKVIKLLVKSNNDVWTPLQNLAGGANAVNDWSKKMGYTMQSARGMGNNANAVDMCKFWSDVCNNKFGGAEVIFRVTASCQTSGARSRKYLPTSVFIGSKTGTYESSNHDTGWLQVGDDFYSISVLSELGASGSEAIASMFRGLYDEYIK
jgi:hypothetical protein